MLSVDADILWRLAPHEGGQRAVRQREIIDGIGAAFAATLESYAIDTPLRVAHFLAQIAEESDGFCTTEEYASGRAYENRTDLGNTQPGDGPLFKGRGLIQMTGRANYAAIGGRLKLPLEKNPLSVNEPIVYMLVSCEYWKKRDINPHCDADDLITVTQLVNGGQNGIDMRRAYLQKAKALLAGLGAASVTPPGGGITVLHRGSEGSAVTMLQQRLVVAGYPVALDGIFGAGTEVAVKHFQAQAKLAADGIVGAQTWKALQPAPASPAPAPTPAPAHPPAPAPAPAKGGKP